MKLDIVMTCTNEGGGVLNSIFIKKYSETGCSFSSESLKFSRTQLTNYKHHQNNKYQVPNAKRVYNPCPTVQHFSCVSLVASQPQIDKEQSQLVLFLSNI